MEIKVFTDGRFALAHPGFSPVLRDLARLIPGMSWDPEVRAWVGSPDAVEATANLLLARKIEVRGIALLSQAKTLREPMAVIASKGKGGLTARKYQLEGVRFLLNRGREGCILAFTMGLGKTPTGTLAARALGYRTVIVCPASVKGVTKEARSWRRDLGIWYPKAKLFFPEGVSPKKITAVPEGTDVVVINYDILYAWLESLIAWGPKVLGLDEGHIMSGKNSRRSQAVAELRAVVSYCWIFTGTPMLNKPKDLWGILCALCPGRFGDPEKGFFKMMLRYCGATQVEIEAIGKTVWNFDGISNAPELKRRFEWFMLRKQMSDPDVAMELPPKVRLISWVEMAKRSARTSNRVATNKRELQSRSRRGGGREAEPSDWHTGLRRVCAGRTRRGDLAESCRCRHRRELPRCRAHERVDHYRRGSPKRTREAYRARSGLRRHPRRHDRLLFHGN